jgi:Carboxypeptidase regulatory-like domain
MNKRFIRYLTYFFAVSVLSLLVPLAALAQTSSINGVVTDPSGAVIPGVQVTVTETATHLTRTVTTNSSGFYVATNLPAGLYDVRAEKQGFQASLHQGVHLDPASTVGVNIALKIGAVTQEVSVTASAVHLQTGTSEVSRLVDSTQMTQLPLNGRNFVSLLGLQPGVVQTFTFNNFEAEDTFASQSTQVNGLTGESNNFLIDGTPSTRTRANGAMVAMPSSDAIAEVNIVTNGYMPEYGRGAGGQMIVTLKSGTDKYHGSVYEFNRNDAMNARYFFSAGVPKLTFNDFGFTIGGPVPGNIFKNKLYFFESEEWMREVDGNTDSTTVPTANDLNGNLNGYCAVFSGQCPTVPSYLNGVGGLVGGQPFPNNTIPTNLISPNGSALLGMYLPPNTVTQPGTAYPYEGGTNEIVTYNDYSNSRADTVKVNYNLNDKNTMYVSLRQYDKAEQQPFYGGSGGGSGVLGIGYVFPSRSASFDWTTTFSPTMLNDFTFSGGRDYNNPIPLPGLPGHNGLDRTSLGITYPYIIPANSKDVVGKIPTLIVSGFENVSGLPYPSFSTGHIWTVQDILTKVQGNHTLKMGVWWEHDGENDADQVRVSPGGGVGNNLNGQFEFDGSGTNTTGSPLGDALLGNFDNYSELGYRDYTLWGAHQVAVFGQDSWKVNRRLMVQGGLRWSYFQPYSANWCNWGMFNPLFYSQTAGIKQVVDPTTGQIVGGNPYNGISVPCSQLPSSAAGHFSVLGQPLTTSNLASINSQLVNLGMMRGLSPQILQSQYGNFQPRFGFAYEPFGNGTTVIRGGGGIFYNHNTLSDVTLMGGNTPFQLATEVFSGSADNPGGTTGASLPIPMTGQDLVNKVPVVYAWNFGIQHLFFNNTLVDVAYVGNRGKHFPINADLNQPAIGTFNNPANTGISQAYLRPYPGIGGAMTTLQEGNTQYDSLQVSVQRRFTNGLQYNLAYTYSKAFAMGGDIYAVVTDTYNPKYNWGPTYYSQNHSAIFTWIYDLPFFKGRNDLAGRTLGGWEISGDAAFVSGFPNNVSASGDPLGNGVNLIGGTEFAAIKQGCNTRGSRSFNQFFNTSCFFQPTSATLAGTAAPGIIEGPGVDNVDFALMKNGNILEKWGHTFQYQLRGEFFNVLNHPSFTGVDTTVTDSNFGQITSAATQREIQIGLKLLF